MEKLLRYDAPAKIFEEALPIGNGSLGAMIYADTEYDKITINHDTLWSGKPGHNSNPQAKESFLKAQALVSEGKYHDAQVELEKKRMVNEVKDEVSVMAIGIASAVIERDVSADEHKALIDDFINNIGNEL